MKVYAWPRWLKALMLGAIPVVALGMVGLGFWQLSRLQERRALNAEIQGRLAQPPIQLQAQLPATDLAALEYRPVVVSGTFDFGDEIVWKNQAYEGAPGVHVITPLQIAGGQAAVLVDRGWIPYTDAEAGVRARYQAPAGQVSITGWLRLPVARTADFLPADPPLGPDRPRLDDWFWLDIGRIQAQVPYPLLPMLITETTPASQSPLPIPDTELDLSEGPHLGYAIQWFAFAAIAVLGPLIYWRQTRRAGRASP